MGRVDRPGFTPSPAQGGRGRPTPSAGDRQNREKTYLEALAAGIARSSGASSSQANCPPPAVVVPARVAAVDTAACLRRRGGRGAR